VDNSEFIENILLARKRSSHRKFSRNTGDITCNYICIINAFNPGAASFGYDNFFVARRGYEQIAIKIQRKDVPNHVLHKEYKNNGRHRFSRF
tara:strand:- start:206 stop:481 length:276 start_codon:yes stop_codon:yes gene_type:complete